MKKTMFVSLAIVLLSFALVLPGLATDWTQDGSTYWWQGKMFKDTNPASQAGLMAENTDSQLWISRTKNGGSWTWSYYVYNQLPTTYLTGFEAGLADAESNHYSEFAAGIFNGSGWTDITNGSEKVVGDPYDVAVWSGYLVQKGSYIKFSFNTELQSWAKEDADGYPIYDEADGTKARSTDWAMTAAPAAVPEPGTIFAALSVLAPAGFAFRRRKN